METPKYFFQYRDDAQKLFLREYVYALGTFHYNWHDEIELLVILRGRADICTGGCVYQLEEDDMILINSNEGHATLARSADCLAFLIVFRRRSLKHMMRIIVHYGFSCSQTAAPAHSCHIGCCECT
ncbi:MAG: cupin domain-containing protein [Faecalibacterium prausnitzii]